MTRREYRWIAAVTGVIAGTAPLSLEAQPRDAAPPARVEVALVGPVVEDPALFGRIRSLFDPVTDVELRTEAHLDSRAVLAPEDPDTVYVWITLDDLGEARVYVTTRDAAGGHTRYLFRDVTLDAGLDEVGSEVLAQVAHSSARALWTREQQTSRDELVAELERDAAPPADSRAPATVNREPPPSPAPRPIVRASKPRRVEPRTPLVRYDLGAEFAMHSSGDEGWLLEPGGFAALVYREHLSFRLKGAYLVPREFELSPAQIRLTGALGDARVGVSVGADGPRVRLEAGAGVLVGRWSPRITSPDPPASAGESEDVRRGYAVVAAGVEMPVGPLWLGARAELRIPFRETTYEVSGGDGSSASSWLNPGAALEIGIPLGGARGGPREPPEAR